jgi:hypothetical protein
MQTKVDLMALRFNQASIITLLALAFLFDQVWLVAFVAVVMLIGTWWPGAGLFKRIYAHVLKPAGLLKPELVVEEARSNLFAQGVGGLVLVMSTLALLMGAPLLGWILAGIVIGLAAVNLFFGFCVGCFLYYQLSRRGIRPSLPGWHSV